MNKFRLAIAIAALMLPFGLAQATTLNSSPDLTNSHPPFSVTEARTLSLRESGSQIVVDTIENALRWGGFKLFDERFQFDSSVNWVLSESLEGELDALIPAWDRNGHVIFVQPGIVFWSGIEEEKRIDANLGAVYRTEVFDGIVGGVNFFYDNDFKMGHSRISVGVDVQKDDFYGAFNYYTPLTDTQDGRDGYVEDALEGMDAILGIESEVARFSGNVGYWNYQGEEDVEDEMEFSYGVDGGIRIFPGFFLEGSLQHHDDASLGRRASIGVAVRFSLPDLTGKSYRNSGGVSNLYKFVDREKRILYEEREAVPKVNLVASGTGNTRNVAVQLDEVFTEDVVLNLIGTGSATYGTDGDWTISVGGEVCDTVAGTGCQVTVTAGQTAAADDVVITIEAPERGERSKDIILSVVIASTGVELAPGNPLVVQIPEGAPLPTVSFNYNGSMTVQENAATNHVTMTLELSEELGEAVTLNLVAGGAATYGRNTINHDWQIRRRIVSVGHTPGDSEIFITGCPDAVSGGNGCEITFQPGQTIADIHLQIHEDGQVESPESFTISVEVASGSTHLVQPGNPSSLEFTIAADPPLASPTVSLNYSGPTRFKTVNQTQPVIRMTIDLSRELGENVTLNITGNGANYGVRSTLSNDWHLRHRVVPDNTMPGGDVPDTVAICPGVTGTMCQVTIPSGSTAVDVEIQLFSVDITEETINIGIDVASAGSTGLTTASPSTQSLTYFRPTATLNYSGSTTITSTGDARMRIDLSEPLSEPVTATLKAGGTAMFAKNGGMGTWSLRYLVLPENSSPAASFPSSSAVDCLDADITGTGCQITIQARQTIVDIVVSTELLSSNDTVEVTLTIGSGAAGTTGLVEGTPNVVELTAQ